MNIETHSWRHISQKKETPSLVLISRQTQKIQWCRIKKLREGCSSHHHHVMKITFFLVCTWINANCCVQNAHIKFSPPNQAFVNISVSWCVSLHKFTLLWDAHCGYPSFQSDLQGFLNRGVIIVLTSNYRCPMKTSFMKIKAIGVTQSRDTVFICSGVVCFVSFLWKTGFENDLKRSTAHSVRIKQRLCVQLVNCTYPGLPLWSRGQPRGFLLLWGAIRELPVVYAIKAKGHFFAMSVNFHWWTASIGKTLQRQEWQLMLRIRVSGGFQSVRTTVAFLEITNTTKKLFPSSSSLLQTTLKLWGPSRFKPCPFSNSVGLLHVI